MVFKEPAWPAQTPSLNTAHMIHSVVLDRSRTVCLVLLPCESFSLPTHSLLCEEERGPPGVFAFTEEAV